MSSTQEVGQIFGDGSGPAQAMLRSPTVIIAAVGLWGMNIYFFKWFKIDYIKVLNLDLVKEQQEKERHQNGDCSPGSSSSSSATPRSSSSTTNGSPSKQDIGGNMDNDEEKESFLRNEDSSTSTDSSHNSISTIDQRAGGITWPKLVFLSFFLLILLHVTTYVWIDILGGGSIGAVLVFYTSVVLLILVPLKSTRWLRTSTYICLHRAYELVNPRCSCITGGDPIKGPRPIPFIDVFYADAMCSLSKVFFDWGMLWHLASHYPNPVPPALDTILIPSFCAAIPYLIRARQCLIMNTVGYIKKDSKRYLHIVNAVKYASSIFPLCMSAYQQIIIVNMGKDAGAAYEPIIITLLVVNSLYALAWDIMMDWGMMQNPKAIVNVDACVPAGLPTVEPTKPPPQSCATAFLRPRLRFGICISTVILLADCILRFAWALRFFPGLFPNKDYFVLFTQFLEAFRRAIWNLLRVEWENIKQTKASKNHNHVEDNEEAKSYINSPRAPKAIQMTTQVGIGSSNGPRHSHAASD